MDTLGALKQSLRSWLREGLDMTIATDAIGDAVENLWRTILLASLSQSAGGPVNITIVSGSERITIISITDPTTPPILTDSLPTGFDPSGLPSRVYRAVITYVTESGSETLPSPMVQLTIGNNNWAGVQLPEAPTDVDIFGWNAYISINFGVFSPYYRINSAPIPLGQNVVFEPSGGLSFGMAAPMAPTVNTTGDDIAAIRKIEVLTPDNTYKQWEGADIESDLFRRAERSIASSSPYQMYVYDLLNNQTLEIRPALGFDAIPRYFYVKKPRRPIYDSAILPFQSIGAMAFLRYKALSAIKLTLEEMDSAMMWDKKASEERENILLAVNIQNSQRTTRITPFMRG